MKLRITTLIYAIGGWLFTVNSSAQTPARNPTISLFPTTVVENLRATGEVATEIENGLEGIVQRIDQQRQLYEDSECLVNELDSGCISLRKQMSQTYLDILKHLEQGLPEIQRTMAVTQRDLQQRLRSQLGTGVTPAQLQNLLLNAESASENTDPIRRLQRQGGTRLSQRFQQYYQLVRTSSSSSQNSLAIMASEIFLDLSEAQKFLELTQQEMQRARIMVELDHELGLVSGEMLSVVDGVKSIIFGQEIAAPTQFAPASVLESNANAVFRSPLER